MIGYVCKYTPVEIIRAFDDDVLRIEPEVRTYEKSEGLTHPNMCSFMKAALEDVLEKHVDGVVLVDCCDSIRRLADILKGRVKFLHVIDLPRKINENSCRLFYKELCRFIRAFENYRGEKFRHDKFRNILSQCRVEKGTMEDSIAVMGARIKDDMVKKLEARCNVKVVNLTCTGNDRLSKIKPGDNLIYEYARALLNSYPCMRMAEDRLAFLKNFNLRGIIYNTVKFCDFYSFEYAFLKKSLEVPVLKIETDYVDFEGGQIMTRLDAFLESVGVKNTDVQVKNRGYFMGIDSGSTSTNAVILDNDKKIVSYSIVPTGAGVLDSAREAYRIALEKAHLKGEDIAFTVSTGYGRISIPFSNKSITEITCHGKGAFYLDSSVRTVIDIGGQDSKVIRLDDSGNVVDFVMNDKCSAGTGRFLEVMARALQISVEEMAQVVTDFKEDIAITSMCTVFAESEVISLIAQNKDKRDIIRGLNRSVASKVVSLMARVGMRGKYMMTGGVAKNRGVVHEIEDKTREKLIIPFEPQIVGALGAALIASGENTA